MSEDDKKLRDGEASAAPSCSAWRVDYAAWNVRPVECPDGIEWPEKDADGETIYDNTHFADHARAVAKLHSNAKASISLDRDAIARAEKEIRRLKDVIVAASAAFLIEPNVQV
jgi:hypothetical protein